MKKHRINGSFTVEELAMLVNEHKEEYFVRIGDAITSPDATREFLSSQLSWRADEVFCVMFLDNRHRVIAFEKMFTGTIDGATVHPRAVVRAALHHNCAAIILAHNHPSGIADPSQADIAITERLKTALGYIDVRVLDHFIVGESITSFSERGLL